jgi:hypothetical protein
MFTNKFKKYCRLYNIFIPSAVSLIPFWMWYESWMNGGTKLFMIDINMYGEAISELILFVVILPMIVYGMYLNVMSMKNEVNEG